MHVRLHTAAAEYLGVRSLGGSNGRPKGELRNNYPIAQSAEGQIRRVGQPYPQIYPLAGRIAA